MNLTKTIDSTLTLTTTKAFVESIDFRVARSRQELQNAYRLVYREYLKRGYTKQSDSQLRLSIFNALPKTTTFIAVNSGVILATATVIADSPLGMPMDEIYHRELEPLRKKQHKLCEVSMLASDTTLFHKGTSLLLSSKKMFLVFFLFKTILDYVRYILGLDCICITINPKHNLIYDFLLFKDLGQLKTYRQANNAPAIAKYVDLHTIEKECIKQKKAGMRKMFFQKKSDAEQFRGKFKFSADDLRYFFVQKTDIFKQASVQQLAVIKNCYPTYDFAKIIL